MNLNYKALKQAQNEASDKEISEQMSSNDHRSIMNHIWLTLTGAAADLGAPNPLLGTRIEENADEPYIEATLSLRVSVKEYFDMQAALNNNSLTC